MNVRLERAAADKWREIVGSSSNEFFAVYAFGQCNVIGRLRERGSTHLITLVDGTEDCLTVGRLAEDFRKIGVLVQSVPSKRETNSVGECAALALRGNPEEAINCYRQILQSTPRENSERVQILYLLAILSIRNGETNRAFEFYEQLVDAPISAQEAHFEAAATAYGALANRAVAAGDARRGRSLLQQGLETLNLLLRGDRLPQAKRDKACLHAAILSYRLSEFDKALQWTEQVKLDPNKRGALLLAGRCYEFKGLTNDALRVYRKLQTELPDYAWSAKPYIEHLETGAWPEGFDPQQSLPDPISSTDTRKE